MTPVKTGEEAHEPPVRRGYSGAFGFIAEFNFRWELPSYRG